MHFVLVLVVVLALEGGYPRQLAALFSRSLIRTHRRGARAPCSGSRF
jgi:hypothetical protein